MGLSSALLHTTRLLKYQVKIDSTFISEKKGKNVESIFSVYEIPPLLSVVLHKHGRGFMLFLWTVSYWVTDPIREDVVVGWFPLDNDSGR